MDYEDLARILRGDPLTEAEQAGYADEVDEIIAAERTRRGWKREDYRQQSDRLFKAMMLAKTVEDCDALLRGEEVPLERLHQNWVKRFGLDHGNA